MFAAQAALAIDTAALLEGARRDAELRAKLLDEVGHRIKNNLSAVMGLLYPAEEALPRDPGAMAGYLAELASAVRGLLQAHNILSANAWQPVLLSDLATTVVRSAVRATGRRLRLSLDVRPSPVRVDADQAHALALVLNELATNSVKHGAAARGDLAIAILAEQGPDGVRLAYTDDGPGCDPEVFGGPQAVGSRLVMDLVRDQLGGVLTVDGDSGFRGEIEFPLTRS
jgi:two-component sensor histidine kinase